MTEPTCERFGKWIGGCRFEPRYDLGASGLKVNGARGYDLEKIAEAYRDKTYVADVCIRCGKQVKRP